MPVASFCSNRNSNKDINWYPGLRYDCDSTDHAFVKGNLNFGTVV